MFFTEEQEAFRKTVRDFAARELKDSYLPRARSLDFPYDAHAKLAEAGLLGLGISEQYGGQGADRVTIGIAAEEVAYADFSCSFLLLGGFGELFERAAPELAETWLPRIVAGEEIIAGGLTEPQAGSDLASVRTTAQRTRDGWTISGEKTSISLAGAATAMMTLARIVEDGETTGTGLFLVPMDADGVTRRPFDDLGFRPIGRGAVNLDGVELDESAYIPLGGRGFQSILALFDFTRPVLGLMAVGTARAGIDEACEYAKERVAFGSPIGAYQGVSFPLAEHATRIEAARLLCYYTLALRDRELPHTKEAAMCKWWAPKVAVDALKDCLLTYGNYGYDQELPAGQRMLDVMSLEIGDGTAQIQKLVIARHMLGRLA